MTFEFLPKSIALIPDGNRRWAKAHNVSVLDGYNIGVKKFMDFGRWCNEYGISNLTVWALSSENLKRPIRELNALFDIYRRALKDKTLIHGMKINVIGNGKLLPGDLFQSLKTVEDQTADNTGGVVNILMGYGGKDDIVHAAKRLAGLSAQGYTINEESFRESLLSSKVPNIDYIIRTSGEKRLSGFMPWQTGYSELYFSKKLWPDFTKRDLYYALADYNKRERRFGR